MDGRDCESRRGGGNGWMEGVVDSKIGRGWRVGNEKISQSKG